MSKYFNRDKAMNFLNRSTGFFELAKKRLEAQIKICDLCIKVTSDEELKNDVCDSLEHIFSVVENHGISLYKRHAKKFEADTKDVMDSIREAEDLKFEFKYGEKEDKEKCAKEVPKDFMAA